MPILYRVRWCDSLIQGRNSACVDLTTRLDTKFRNVVGSNISTDQARHPLLLRSELKHPPVSYNVAWCLSSRFSVKEALERAEALKKRANTVLVDTRYPEAVEQYTLAIKVCRGEGEGEGMFLPRSFVSMPLLGVIYYFVAMWTWWCWVLWLIGLIELSLALVGAILPKAQRRSVFFSVGRGLGAVRPSMCAGVGKSGVWAVNAATTAIQHSS